MYLSLRHCLVATEDFDSPAAGMRHLGVKAFEVELTHDFRVCAMDSCNLVPIESDGDAKAYKERIEGLGLEACCFLTACDFSAGEQADNVAWVARAIELADVMGMPCVRIDSAMRRERELDFETRVNLFADNLKAALDRTAGSHVTLGIENHGYQGNNLAFQLNVYRRVGDDRLGATMDTGNFYWRGYPLSEVYGILRILAPYARHTHLKNINYPEQTREVMREGGWEYDQYVSPLDEGDIDHAKVLRILAEAGYDGDICIEDESLHHYATPEERIAVLERDVAHVRACIDAVNA